jgi:hypothetical protein
MYHTQTQRIFQSFFNIFNQFLLYDDSERLVIIVIFEEISLFIFARVRKSMLNYGSARRSLSACVPGDAMTASFVIETQVSRMSRAALGQFALVSPSVQSNICVSYLRASFLAFLLE